MSYIKFEHRHLGDARWLDLSAAAFVVHAWALDYCNEQATDGSIPRKMALRLVCPVMPADLQSAWDDLCDAGIWEIADDGYICPQFAAHGLGAAEQDATRMKWANDKRRQRLHNIGNHQLCSPSRCPGAFVSTSGQVDTSSGGQVDDQTRPDQTRPDQTPEGGSGMGSGGADEQLSAPGSAAPPAVAETRGSQEPPRPPDDPEARLSMRRHAITGICCPFGPEHPIHQVRFDLTDSKAGTVAGAPGSAPSSSMVELRARRDAEKAAREAEGAARRHATREAGAAEHANRPILAMPPDPEEHQTA